MGREGQGRREEEAREGGGEEAWLGVELILTFKDSLECHNLRN